jgi:hypothetical protein
MQSLIALFYVLLMVVGGSAPGRDALDAVPTEVYWGTKGITPSVEMFKGELSSAPPATLEQDVKDLGSDDFKTREGAKKRLEAGGAAAAEKLRALDSKDPEVQALTADLAGKFLTGRVRSVQRLMAIRGLGEKRDASAVDLLKPLLASKAPFEAVYAARALAQIEGKPWTAPDHSKDVAGEVALVQKDATAVVQVMPIGLDAMSLEKVAEYGLSASMRPRGMAGAAPAVEAARQAILKRLVAVVEQVGNFRVDGVTVGMNLGGPEGWVEVIIHGEFDGRLIAETVSGQKAQTMGGGEGVALGDRAVVLLSAPERLVAVVPVGGGDVTQTVAEGLKGGASGLAGNAEIEREVKAVDKSGPVWAVARVTPMMRQTPMFAGADVVRLSTKALPGGKVGFTFSVEGSDGEKLKAGAEEVNTRTAAAARDIEAELARMAWEREGLAPVVELMNSMKASAEGTKGMVTGEAPAELSRMFMMGAAVMSQELERRADPAATQR